MQFRRRWSAGAFWVGVAACSAITALAAIPPGLPSPTAVAARLKTAHGQEAVDIRADIIDNLKKIPSVIDRNDYGGQIATAFEPLLAEPNSDAQINAAIAIGQLHTLYSADTLVRMLTHPNAAVRYWGAKGLAENADVKAVAGPLLDNAIKALQAALGKETSGLVKKQLVNALAALADTGHLLDGMAQLAGTISSSAPDQATLEAVSLGLADLDSSFRTAPNATLKLKIVTLAVNIASFTSQQEVALLKSRQASGGTLPDGYHANVRAVIDNTIKLLNTAAGKTAFSLDTSGGPEELKLLLDGVIGSATLGPGQVQKEFPGVLVPSAIKEPPASAPATAATRAGGL